MFNIYKPVKVITVVENGDNLKVERLVNSYIKSGTRLDIDCNKCGIVTLSFITLKSLRKQLEHDLKVLRLVGIVVGIEA